MRYRFSLLLAVCVPLLLLGSLGCPQSDSAPSATPSNDPAAGAAVNARVEEVKKENPNMPPTGIGTRAAREAQMQQQRQGQQGQQSQGQ